ncbi:MAG: GGDEF domain-containing protein [Candidatus Margulisbacteria bacterium]|nr:GGDEF domain-containing protein [Candidatus Margulisiibacteriota bacterium]
MSAKISPAAEIRSRLLDSFHPRTREIAINPTNPLDRRIMSKNLNYLVPAEAHFYNNGKINAAYAATFVEDFVETNRICSNIKDVTAELISEGIIEEPSSKASQERAMVYRARVWGGMMDDELAAQQAYRSRLDALMNAIHDIYGLKLKNSKRQEALIKCVIEALGYGGVRGYEVDLLSAESEDKQYLEFLRFGVKGESRFFAKWGKAQKREEKGFLYELLKGNIPQRQLDDEQRKGVYSWHKNGKIKLLHIQKRKGWEYTDLVRYTQDEALNGVDNVDEMMFLVLGDEQTGKVRVYQIDNWEKNGTPLFMNKTEDMALLQTFAETVAQSEENERLLEQVEELSIRDKLTGLFNRRHFEVRLRDELERTARLEESPLSLLMIDIDHFKVFNDNYGHKMGDKVLRLVAETILNSVREIDVVARYGGEEIVVILPATNHEGADAKDAAERIRQAVEDISLMIVDEKVHVTVSVGVAVANKMAAVGMKEDLKKGKEIEELNLVANADSMLYKAKKNGRNRIEGPVARGN